MVKFAGTLPDKYSTKVFIDSVMPSREVLIGYKGSENDDEICTNFIVIGTDVKIEYVVGFLFT